jgi:ankyrin repeat protein
LAAYYGNPETIEWIFSDAPLKAIEEFIKSHELDKRAKMLETVKWRSRVAGWLGTKFTSNRDNAFHAALIGRKNEGIDTVYQMFIKQGIAPLTILESKQQKPKHDSLLISARISIDFGNIYEKYAAHRGDPTIVDGHGYNVLHILIHTKNASALNFLLGRLSDFQKTKMIMQKTFRTLYSPISLAVRSQRVDVVQNLLDHGLEQLHLRDGDGNLPIHTAVANGYAKVVQLLISADSTTLLMEDAAGLLPIEVAQNQYLLTRTQVDPIANIYAVCSYSKVAWYNDRPEHREAKSFVETTSKDSFMDVSDAVATFEVVKKAMAGVDLKDRQFVSLLDVTDVIRRATKYLDKERGPEYRLVGAHLAGEHSLWQTSKEEH